jgi:hypothetical protein
MRATKREDCLRSEVPGLVPENLDGAPVEATSIEHRAMMYLGNRLNLVESNLRFKEACKAIARLQRDPFQCLDLSSLLAFLACTGVSRQGGARKTWEKLWSVGTGKTWKALKDFPCRLRGLADEVERINSSIFFAPQQYVTAETVKATIVRRRFSELPVVLRLYGSALEQHVRRVPGLIAQNFPPSPRGYSKSIFKLSELVKGATGRYHDKEVTELLNAAAVALGETFEMSALDLAQARSRRKKRDN